MILQQYNKQQYGILQITVKENGKYDKTQNTGWLNYTTDGLKNIQA